MLKHERIPLVDYGERSRRYNLRKLGRILCGERPETVIAVYDKYGDKNPLVDQLLQVADMEMSQTEWLRDRIEYCVEQINTVRNLLFDLYANTHIGEIREALDRFTNQREIVCRLLKTDCPLSTTDREYLLELLRDPSAEPAVKRMSKRKSTPNK